MKRWFGRMVPGDRIATVVYSHSVRHWPREEFADGPNLKFRPNVSPFVLIGLLPRNHPREVHF
jgi:hypothetical protein